MNDPGQLADRLSELLESLYAAVAEPTLWPQFMERLSVVLGGPVAFHDLDANKSALFRHAVRFDPELLAAYNSHWGAVNPWLPAQRARPPAPGAVVLSSELYSESRLTRTEFYDGFLEPQQLFYSIGIVFQKQGSRSVRLTSLRAKTRGPFDAGEQRLLRLLAPHLGHAFTIQEKIGCFVERSRALTEIVDRLPIALLLLDDRGSFLYANARAEDLLRHRDGLVLDSGRTLAATSHAETKRLRELIAQAMQVSAGHGHSPAGSMSLTRADATDRPLPAVVLPLKSDHYFIGATPAAAAVLVSEPEECGEFPEQVARSLYDLTPAEARLAGKLLGGKHLKEIAGELDVSIHTVRAQMKSIFAKTGTSGQSELVRLLALGPGLIVGRAMRRQRVDRR